MSINNREDANRYYDQMRKLVSDYMSRERIRPSELSGYMKPGGEYFNLFLKMSNLREVNGIDVVLKDTIQDILGMEEDGVMTFESFKIYESDEFKVVRIEQCLRKGIMPATREAEQAISDFYDTDLGFIELMTEKEYGDVVEYGPGHSFSVEGWEKDVMRVVAYHQEEIEIIYENLSDFIYQEASGESINLPIGVQIPLKDVLDEQSFKSNLRKEMVENRDFEGRKFIGIIEAITKAKYVGKKKNYFLFEGSITPSVI